MRKFENWLVKKFLPAYAKQILLEENARLAAEISELKATVAEQNAYIDGLEAGIRAQRKIVINATREVSK